MKKITFIALIAFVLCCVMNAEQPMQAHATEKYYVKNDTLYVAKTKKKAKGYVLYEQKNSYSYDPTIKEYRTETYLYYNGKKPKQIVYKDTLYLNGEILKGTFKYKGVYYTNGVKSSEKDMHIVSQTNKEQLYCGQAKCKGLRGMAGVDSESGSTWYLNGEKLTSTMYGGYYFDKYGRRVALENYYNTYTVVDPYTLDVYIGINEDFDKKTTKDFSVNNGKIVEVRQYNDDHGIAKDVTSLETMLLFKVKGAALDKPIKLSIANTPLAKFKDQPITVSYDAPKTATVATSTYKQAYDYWATIYNWSPTDLSKRFGIDDYEKWQEAVYITDYTDFDDYDDEDNYYYEYSCNDEDESDCEEEYYPIKENKYEEAEDYLDTLKIKDPIDDLKYIAPIQMVSVNSKEQLLAHKDMAALVSKMLLSAGYERFPEQ